MANRVQVFFNQFPQFDYPDPDPDPPFDLLSIHDEEEYGTSDEDNYDAIYILSLPRTITTNPSSYNQQELIVIPDDDESQNCFREDGSNKRCRTELESEASRSKDIDHLLCPQKKTKKEKKRKGENSRSKELEESKKGKFPIKKNGRK